MNYESQITMAKTMAETDKTHHDYWTGYVRGLMKNHYGEKFGTQAEHQTWLNASGDDTRNNRSRGYRDGFEQKTPCPDNTANVLTQVDRDVLIRDLIPSGDEYHFENGNADWELNEIFQAHMNMPTDLAEDYTKYILVSFLYTDPDQETFHKHSSAKDWLEGRLSIMKESLEEWETHVVDDGNLSDSE